MEEVFIYYLIGVPLLGILAQWLGWRFRLPSILLLLGFGIALGQIFGLNPDDLLARLADTEDGSKLGPELLFPIVTISVAIILFEGGLSLRFSELKEAGAPVLGLITIGVVVSWVLTTLLAKSLLGLEHFRIAALIGAVLVVTGPTVVAPLLRHIRPNRTVSSVVKWEGIVIDPIGALLAVLVFEYTIALEHDGFVGVLISLFLCTVVAGGIGLGAAFCLIQAMKRFWLPDYLHTVTIFAAVLGAFGLANLIHPESGLVTVTVFGIVLANQKQVAITHVVEFKESLGVLLISCLFIVLGSRVELTDIGELGWQAWIFLALLIIVVRPISVMCGTIRSGLSMSERLFIGCLAPRGIVAAAVTAVFALKVTHLAESDAELSAMSADAERLVPITFLVIIGTVAFYGLTAAPLARMLHLADDKRQGILFGGADDIVRSIAEKVHKAGFPVLLVDTHYQHVAAAQMSGLRAECMSLLSERVYDDVDLSGIGYALAMTPNDEVNAMAIGELRHVFGRANAFRLYSRDTRSGKRASVSEHHPGRMLFAERATYTWLASRIDAGWTVKSTSLTDTFGYDQFLELYGEDALVMFTIDRDQTLNVVSVEQSLSPKPGQTVIALVDPRRAATAPEAAESGQEDESADSGADQD